MVMRVPTLSGPTHPPAPIRSLAASIDVLVNFLREGAKGRGTMILTGAGVSVDSGIRAYRGKDGSYTVNKERQPIFYGQFVEHEAYRRRYWARSFLGYVPVRAAEPNPTHYAVAALQKMGHASSLITQNVDGLHHKAWDRNLSTYLAPPPTSHGLPPSATPLAPDTPPILELHGTLRHAHCLSCGTSVGRDAFQDRLAVMNPEWARYSDEVEGGREERLNPDGDIELGEGVKYEEFNVPPCDSCGGSMKPKVVFFGESLSPEVREDSKRLVREASQVLVIGSELATFSAYSLVKQKREEGGQLGLVNVGRCRGDPDFNWRIGWEGGAGDILPAAAKILAQDEGRAGIKEEVDLMLRSGKVKKISGTRATT